MSIFTTSGSKIGQTTALVNSTVAPLSGAITAGYTSLVAAASANLTAGYISYTNAASASITAAYRSYTNIASANLTASYTSYVNAASANITSAYISLVAVASANITSSYISYVNVASANLTANYTSLINSTSSSLTTSYTSLTNAVSSNVTIAYTTLVASTSAQLTTPIQAAALNLSQVTPLIQKLQLNAEPANVIFIGDSTGNETREWIYQMAVQLAPYYPTHTVNYYLWDSSINTYHASSLIIIQTGSTTGILNIWNGSVAGTATDYFQGSRMVGGISSKDPDLIVTNYGHNQSAFTGNINYFRNQVRGSMMSLVQNLRLNVPRAGIVLFLQNPNRDQLWQHYRVNEYTRLAMGFGLGTINSTQAFLNYPSWQTQWMTDSLHPNGTGSLVQAGVALPCFLPRSTFENASFIPATLTNVGKTLIDNSYLIDMAGLVPTGWVATNLTCTKDYTIYESNRSSSLKLTSTATTQGYIRYRCPASVYNRVKGKWVTLSVKEYRPTGCYTPSGRLSISDGIDSIVSDQPADSYDGWFWHTISFKVATNPSYLDFYIYGGTNSSTSTVMYIQEVHAVEGDIPLLSAAPATPTSVAAEFVPFSNIIGYNFNGISGSGIAANNSTINYGTSNFGIGVSCIPKTLTPATEMPLINYAAGSSGWKFALATTGALKLYIGATAYTSDETIVGYTSIGSNTTLLASLARTSYVTFYCNSKQVGNPISIAAQSGVSVNSSGSVLLGIDGSSLASVIFTGAALFNGSIDGSFYGSTGIPAIRKWGGAAAYSSNFATTDGWSAINGTRTANATEPNTGTTAMLSFYADSTSGASGHGMLKSGILSSLVTYRLTMTYYLPTCPNAKALRFYSSAGNNMDSILPIQNITDSLTTIAIDFINPAGNTGIGIRMMNAANSLIWSGSGTADIFYIKDVSLLAVGANVAWEPFENMMSSRVWKQSNPGTICDMLMSPGAILNAPAAIFAYAAFSGSGNTTIDRSQRYITYSTTSSTGSITLPSASSNYGTVFSIKRLGANSLFLLPTGADTIYGTASASSYTFTTDGEAKEVVSDGDNSRWILF